MSEMNKALRHDPPAISAPNGLVRGPAANLPMARPRNGARPIAPPEQGMSPRFVLTALRRWWMVATPIALVLAAISAVAVYLLFEPVYEAAAWLRIQERAPFVAFESKDEGRSKALSQTQIETIRSPFVLGSVIKQPEIARVPEIARQADKVAWLAKQIKVEQRGESEYFRILYSDPDPNAAARVVNAVKDAYFNLRDQSEDERNQRVIDLLEQEKEKHLKEVQRLRDNYRTLAKEATGKDPFAGKMETEGTQKHPLADLESQPD